MTYSGTISIASGNVVSYIPLTIIGVGSRNQPTDGKINISSSGKYFNDTFGYTTNTLTTTYRWKVEGGSYSGDIPLTNTAGTGTHSEAQVQVSGFDYTKNYYFEFKAVDKLNTVTSTVLVTKGVPVFNWDNDEFDVNSALKPKTIVTYEDRLSTPNFDHQYPNNKASKRFDIVSSSMNNSGQKPYTDGYLETFCWDNDSAYDTQLFIPNGIGTNSKLQIRGKQGSSNWSNNWKDIPIVDGFDYGDWTPSYRNCTYTNYEWKCCKYIKFGKVVILIFHDRPTITAVSGDGNAIVTGLPYPPVWPQTGGGGLGTCLITQETTVPVLGVNYDYAGIELNNATDRGQSNCHFKTTSGGWFDGVFIYICQ